ncbi:winged helix DNA-binding domain-containing protein [Actinomycetospora termitidis]|uniref:Winged helix DNA-binding domain-containing protein n=1 Tax=Actinomycetospora termitidis TaxID=3053470 RepID=A0ABT7ME43_9PSEU|nr:winged helix DNA-binding domain-containing protein [Actinomycetospora sp. Odt1-22]MDL5157633.1 winged helix DNA-binding domain-containing protein [Actinomycetospora sp. Odt1-22]
MDVTRAQAIAFRIDAQGLHRRSIDGAAALLELGVQHHQSSVAVALAARLPDGPPDDGELAWSHRGAPHRHRRSDLAAWARRLRPLSEPDAMARLIWTAEQSDAFPALAAIDRTAEVLAAAVTSPMTKGEVSTAVSRELPRALQRDCPSCGVWHVFDQLLRLAALPAGVALDGGRTLRALPTPDGWSRPTGPGTVSDVAELVTAAVRIFGPATTADLAAWIGTSAGALASAVEATGLVAVRVEGRRAWVATDDVDRLVDPPSPPELRLLPPFDPMLSARDRALLVPDTERRRALWPALGHPGAVLAGTEVVGTWRPSASGKKLTLTVSGDVPRPLLDDEAERVAAARGLRLAAVTVS